MAYYKVGTNSGGGVLPTGNAVDANVLKDKTFSNASGINKVGTMPDNGAVNVTLDTTTTSYTVPEGYHNGTGTVSISTQSKTVTPSARSATASTVTPDSGKVLSEVTVDTTSVPNANTDTYSATSRGSALDMGSTNTYRYVNTTGVPNTNSGTYTFASGDTGGTKDLGETNTYRYVNATNVYNKGKADGQVGTEKTLWTNSSPTSNQSDTTITLSESYKNFNKIRIYYRLSTSKSTTYNIDVPIAILSASVSGVASSPRVLVGSIDTSGNYNLVRSIFSVSNTSLKIGSTYITNGTGSMNNYTIVTKIAGID